jgi:NAD(P)H-quinone oxidoreductase subunit 5
MESLSFVLPLAGLVPATAAALAFGRAGRTALGLVTVAVWATFALLMAFAVHAAGSGTPADATGLVLALLTSFVAAIMLSFSQRHMKADSALPLYAGRVGLLVAAVLCFVTATDLFSLGLAWIVSGWLLASLIGHVPNWPEAAAAASRARRYFLMGDVALLGALSVLGISAGTVSISVATAAAGQLAHAEQLLIGGLLLIAALARCAVPPFHDWLMRSMAAPTPVSALMHAGLVNAGGFLLIRFAPILEVAPAVKLAAIGVGAAGALFGIGVMMVRPDVKRALGGSTVAQMSFMIMTCGLGFYAAALWHLVAHGLFKAWLFLGAGSNIGRAPTKAQLEPLTPAGAIMIAGLAIAIVIAWSTARFPVPLVLALATGLSGVGAALRTAESTSGPMLLASAGLILSYVGGVTAFSMLPGIARGETVLPLLGQAALALVFVGAWVWQTARLPLPTPLYIRFLNSGGPALIR